MQQDSFSQFIEALLAEQGAGTLPKEIVQEMRTELTGQLQEFLLTKLVAQLTEEQRTALQQKVSLGAPTGELLQFFQKTFGDDYDNVIGGILASFRAAYID